MTLHKSMWKAAVLMGIAGVLMFAGGALAKASNTAYQVACPGLSAVYGDSVKTITPAILKEKCSVFGTVTGTTRDTLWRAEQKNSSGVVTSKAGPVTSSSFVLKDTTTTVYDSAYRFTMTGNPALVNWDVPKFDSATVTVAIDTSKLKRADTTTSLTYTVPTSSQATKIGIQAAKIASGDSLAINVKALYNWTRFTTWLGGSGKTFSVGTNVADLGIPEIPLKSGMTETTKNGAIRYRFVGTPDSSTRHLDTVAVPTLPGTYDIYVSFGKGDNHDSTAIKGTVAGRDYVKLTDTAGGKQLRIQYQSQASWAVLRTGDTAVVYNANPTWTLRAPTIDGLVGTADTVIYTATVTRDSGITAAGDSYSAADSAAVAAVTVKPNSQKGATFEFKISGFADGTKLVGGYKVTVDIIGRDLQNKYTFKVSAYTFNVVILPKPLTSDGVTITVNGDGTQAYTYTNTPLTASVTIKDVNRVLTQGDTTDNKDFAVNRKKSGASMVFIEGHDSTKRINAGTASVWVEGAGNYKGVVEKTFTILQRGLTYSLKTDTSGFQYKSDKVYDGTAILGDSAFITDTTDRNPKGGVDLAFNGVQSGDTLLVIRDYKFTTKSLNNATVGLNRTATIVIAPDTGSVVMKNYKLNTTGITVTGIAVTKRDPNTADASASDSVAAFRETFKYTIPTHYFWGDDNAARRGIGSVTYQTGMTNPGATPIKVVYSYPGTLDGDNVDADFGTRTAGVLEPFTGDTTRAPRLAGTYTVKVIILDSTAVGGARGAQHISADTFELGGYTILPPGAPTFAESGDLPAKVDVRTSRTTTLRVTAVPFNYGTEAAPVWGTLSYQWWRSNTNGPTDGVNPPDAVKVGGSRATYEATVTDSVNSVFYWVEVFNGSQTFQQSALGKITSATCEVAPLPPPQTIAGRVVVTLPDSVVYNGTNQMFTTEDSDDGPAELTVSFINVSVGDDGATVRDTVPLTAQTTGDDGSVTGDYRLVYSNNRNVGTATILVVGTDAYTGTVSVTFKVVKRTLTALDLAFVDKRPYTGEALGANVRPVIENETGMGAITVTYNGQATVPKEQGVYNLAVSVAAGSNYTAATNLSLGAYEIGMGVFDSSCISYETMRRLSTDPNLSKGIGAVSFLKGTGFGDSIIITYDGMRDIPTEIREYDVYARILGGVNYAPGNVHIGFYKIVDPNSVAGSDRELPKPGVTNVVTVAPAKVTAPVFTAGPSPVSKGGEIKFFSAKEVKNGSFYIFDASGNAVAKVTAKSGKKGEIGVWNLKDKKGAAVSEGTYVVKGVLVGKDGTKEKVSFPFSVTK